jgi:hypothetical protein
MKLVMLLHSNHLYLCMYVIVLECLKQDNVKELIMSLHSDH